MGQHGVELFTFPNYFFTMNQQLFYFAAENNVTDERGGQSVRALSLNHNLVNIVMVLDKAIFQVEPHQCTACGKSIQIGYVYRFENSTQYRNSKMSYQ